MNTNQDEEKRSLCRMDVFQILEKERKFTSKKPILREIQRQLNASWKICSLAVNGLLFLVIEGYLLNFFFSITKKGMLSQDVISEHLSEEYFLFISSDK